MFEHLRGSAIRAPKAVIFIPTMKASLIHATENQRAVVGVVCLTAPSKLAPGWASVLYRAHAWGRASLITFSPTITFAADVLPNKGMSS